ncbi:MAG: S41 family peptidase [Phycisphaerales bacterium]|nr:MAG: S41 family peptidase [Phycisphaerales bacterium]
MFRLPNSRAWIVVLFAAVLMPSAMASVRAMETASAPDSELDSAWLDAISLIERGAADGQLAGADVSDAESPLVRVAQWLSERAELERSRTELTRTDFDTYVARVQKWHERGKIDKALENALYAYANAADKDAFRREAWLAALRKDAIDKAGERRENKEWLEAHAIYYELSEIFDQDTELRDLRHECLTHARLEELYKEGTGWSEPLEGIDPDMVTEALYRIDQKYVEEPDFRAMTEAGLEQVLLLLESPALRELFECLSDDPRRQEFEERLRIRLDQVQTAGSLNRREAAYYFTRMMQINRQTVQLPEALLAAEFVNGALEELDEFTSVIWPVDYKEFQKHTRGNFIGVGIQIRQKLNADTKCNEVVVVSPLEDTPAYRAGIQADDVIRRVNGESLCELEVSLSKAVDMITGPEGTHVTLTIYRSSEDSEIDFKLKRERVDIGSVKSTRRDEVDEQRWNHLLDPKLGIGYARVTNFQENTVGELRAVIDDLLKQHRLRGFILDLRFNPGGLLTSAVRMAELFLGQDEMIVSTRGLHSRPWPINTEEDGPFKDLPLIILVNEYSASASEIVAGAIKDHRRGLIVGERTFGKFSVQNVIQLVRSDAHLKLTTAHYYLPSGRSLHREDDSTEWGVEPDIKVTLVPKELRKVMDIRRNADVIGPRGSANGDADAAKETPDPAEDAAAPSEVDTPAPADETGAAVPTTQPADDEDDADEEEDEPDPNNRPEVDPQLETALLVMRLRVLSEDFPIIARSSRPEPPPATAKLEEGKLTAH